MGLSSSRFSLFWFVKLDGLFFVVVNWSGASCCGLGAGNSGVGEKESEVSGLEGDWRGVLLVRWPAVGPGELKSELGLSLALSYSRSSLLSTSLSISNLSSPDREERSSERAKGGCSAVGGGSRIRGPRWGAGGSAPGCRRGRGASPG